jgi:hypothetical protein
MKSKAFNLEDTNRVDESGFFYPIGLCDCLHKGDISGIANKKGSQKIFKLKTKAGMLKMYLWQFIVCKAT